LYIAFNMRFATLAKTMRQTSCGCVIGGFMRFS
jgi:hypothetical protein